MGVNIEADRGANLRQTIKDRERDKHVVTNSAHIDDHFTRDFMRQGSSNLRNHDQP